MKEIVAGWSAKKDVIGKSVYNDKGEKVGKIDDVVIGPDKAVSYAIVGTGGFVGLAKHDVVIPVNHLKQEGNRIILPGATKEVLKALPPFQYAKK